MKIAVTADLHLTTQKEHPERYHALEDIIKQMLASEMDTLIIAGDLFDESSRNYSEFDEFCTSSKHKEIKFLVIPGNHDERLNNELLTAENVEIIAEPTIKSFNERGLKFFFLPYKQDKTMGEFIAAKTAELPANDWVLISHGDWAEGLREPNPLEPGVYMPLTRTDIENYRPVNVVLGHIHKSLDRPRMHYTGSPCGLDITETGCRRFLVLDTENGAIQPQTVNTDFIYYNESLVIFPYKDEKKYIKKNIDAIMSKWNFEEDELSKVRIQIKVQGYSANKRALLDVIKESLKGFSYYKDREPDLSNVSVNDDINRAEIAKQVSEWVDKFSWNTDSEQPDKDEILLAALHTIYES